MDSRAGITFLQQTEYWKLLNSSHTLKIYYFTLQINRTIPILCQGLNGTTIGIVGTSYCDLVTTWHGIQFLPDLSLRQYRLCFALRHILGITGGPLCNDPIHYSHMLDGITYPDMQCSNPQCWDHVSGPNTCWVLGPPLCSTRAILDANSLISNCIVASYFCSAHITDICIGVMDWVTSSIVKSRSFCSILSWGLTWGIHLQVQLPCLECTWVQIIWLCCKQYPFWAGWHIL